MLRALKGWKTLAINGVLGGAAVLLEVLQAFAVIDLTPLLPENYAARIITSMAVINIVLRLFTSSRAGYRGPYERPAPQGW